VAADFAVGDAQAERRWWHRCDVTLTTVGLWGCRKPSSSRTPRSGMRSTSSRKRPCAKLRRLDLVACTCAMTWVAVD
jgi:hypothetical protein